VRFTGSSELQFRCEVAGLASHRGTIESLIGKAPTATEGPIYLTDPLVDARQGFSDVAIHILPSRNSRSSESEGMLRAALNAEVRDYDARVFQT
jgi:hypothetical protein